VYPKYCPRSEADYYSGENRAKSARLVVWSVSGNQSKVNPEHVHLA